MSNWDLMMPGMGLTAIGLAGVVISYSGLAHTFIDGMHALTGLTMMIGLIFLSAGILEGGISTSNRAKATTLVVLSIVLSFGAYSFTINTISTTPIFAGILLIIATPAVVMAYVAMKMPKYLKPIGTIFGLAASAGIITFIVFGMIGPDPYLLAEEEPPSEEQVPSEVPSEAPTEEPQAQEADLTVSILEGSAEQGNPDYDPDVATVSKGQVVEWINEDAVQHTVTSSEDFGETFDSGLMDAGASFVLNTGELDAGEYLYMCIVHPWMESTLVVEGKGSSDDGQGSTVAKVSIPQGAGIQNQDQIYYDPDSLTVQAGTTVVWSNDDDAIHTVTSGVPSEGPSEVFDSGMVAAGETFEYTFDETGTFDYYCIVHPWMTGNVIVE